MKRSAFARIGLALVLVALALGDSMAEVAQESGDLVLDNFADGDGRPRVGVAWQGFTDGVMGGRSRMEAGVERAREAGEDPYLRLSGEVSLENNGGFIQVRLLLSDGGAWDAGEYRGVFLEARSDRPLDGGYWMHLRTSRTRMPWAHYEQTLPVTGEWQRIELPFAEFAPSYMLARRGPDQSRLRSLAVVAAKQAFSAQIEVRRIGLYR